MISTELVVHAVVLLGVVPLLALAWSRPGDLAYLRRRWTLWRRRRTRGDRRWQHYGARCWYGMRMRIAAQAAAGAALDHNRARVLEAFAKAWHEVEVHRILSGRT